jgi:hypothetical protein
MELSFVFVAARPSGALIESTMSESVAQKASLGRRARQMNRKGKAVATALREVTRARFDKRQADEEGQIKYIISICDNRNTISGVS